MAPMITQAQPEGSQGPPPIPTSGQIEKMVTELSSELALNDYQSEIISKLYFAHFKEVKEEMQNNIQNRKAHREKMEKLRFSFEKDVKKELNHEQLKKFNEFMKKRGENRQSHLGHANTKHFKK